MLGLREGPTENAEVASALLGDIAGRGVDFAIPRLYMLDRLPDEYKPDIRRKLNAAYAMTDPAAAERALQQLHREPMDLNPSATRSLEEGMAETLTVHQLRVPEQLRRTCRAPT